MADDTTENVTEGQEDTLDPVAAYQAWEDEHIVLIPKGHWFVVEWRKPLDAGNELMTYVTPTGAKRTMSRVELERREKQGKPGYYLLDKDLEAEGVKKVAALQGAPTVETPCSSCNTSLFASDKGVYAHLRDVLELLVMGKLEPDAVTFRRRHRLCWQFERDILNPFIGERDKTRSTLRMSGASNEDEATAVKALVESAQGMAQAWLAERRHEPEQALALFNKIKA